MDALAFFNRGDPPQAGRMLFMPDPTLTWLCPAPCRNIASGRLHLIQEGPRSRTLPKEQNC